MLTGAVCGRVYEVPGKGILESAERKEKENTHLMLLQTR